ncbi:hypothetical protein J2W88_003942 [Acidovorax delafieldii]|uniref:Uncharacterized protein n=1 Tax=Acidovorax delafieldii TaxID=47920 RepID=A0AAJ2BW80_ACIDE|nr:hypothetical protein [Acidovorax delafieldii]MDR6768638.1 hypothetical protein [Acidovorax delafieldii]MDR6837353.1 hypothetical protein [Acidovorax delafieldii]MDR7366844.1 hypothetical protein [Acidovorax delafieldii]
MANQWFRMYSEFATDAKVQMMSEAMQRRYLMLMCLRCSNALVTLHDEEIAFQLRISDEELAETKALFIKKGFIDSAWNLLNWEKRQFASDSSKERVAKHRALQKQKQEQASNCDVTLHETKANGLDTDTDTEQSIGAPSAKSPRGTALPKDWTLPGDWKTWAEKERPDVDVVTVAESFRDFWIAKPGKDGRKADWQATWRNWVRNQRAQTFRKAAPAGDIWAGAVN